MPVDSKGDRDAAFDAKALLDAAPCGILSFTDAGVIRYANEVLLEHLGVFGDDLIGRNISTILSAGDRIFYQTHLFPMVRLHGRADEIFMTLKASDGGDLPVLANAVRVPDGEHFVNHCVVVPVHRRQQFEAELVEARKRAEEALQSNETLKEAQRGLEARTRELDRQLTRIKEQNAELKRLNRIMSHDFREPIRKMATFADIVAAESRNDLSSLGSEAIDKILAASDRMDDLLSRVQQYLSLDTAGEAVTKVDLNEVLVAARDAAKRSPDYAGAVVACASLPEVEGFRFQLKLLFVQLFDNAMKFRKEEEEARIKVECAVVQHNSYRSVAGKYRYVDHARITVTDNGIGFEPRYHDYVFEILKQLDPESPGMGMGLAICKKVVANHFGAISIDSTPDVGTTVTVTLPLKRDEE